MNIVFDLDAETPRRRDAETARRAGVPFALYSGGYRKTPVREMHHDWVFSDFGMLQDIVTEARGYETLI